MEEHLYCLIRKAWVAARPEEVVRQKMLSYMIRERGFLPQTLLLEMPLRQMPHLLGKDFSNIPNRRADIVCFSKDLHSAFPLYPLLLIECKAVKLNAKVINQVVGYNHYVRACYIIVVNQEEIRTGWRDPSSQEYTFINHLPSFEELCSKTVISTHNS